MHKNEFKKKHKLTEKLPTKAEAEAKKKTVIAIKTANPQATAARIIELAAQQGCEVSEGMVHKYISEAGLQERRPATTKPLTQQQKDNIVRLRDAGGTFPDIATTVGCTHAQAYKHYNKDNK
jgi:DNA-binding NarL/FixJ family response regulator